jgi:predicted Zn-ribbon and HTH transcriptional regulator
MIKRNPNEFRKIDSCPKCDSPNITEGLGEFQQRFSTIKRCLECGHEWIDSESRYYMQ